MGAPMKPMVRWAGRLVGLWAVAALVASATGGFFGPPVIAEPWGELAPAPAEERLEAACTTEDGVTLRGYLFPSDPGAPLVVHLMESGASPSINALGRLQYTQLAALGFASLAVDYRGVGRSDGHRSLEHLAVDARAIWEHALALVDGDESRLLVRACSLGTVATATLLDGGARPAAILLHAPVEAATVVTRFGSRLVPVRWIGVPMEWLARPFLRDWISPPTLDSARRAGAPLFVCAHLDDPLLSPAELARLAEEDGAGEIKLCVPERQEYPHSPWPRLLDGHFDLSIQACEISTAERAFLEGAFPQLSPVEARVARVLAQVSDPLLAELQQRPRFAETLAAIVTARRTAHPLAAVAAATQLSPEEIAALERAGALEWLVPPLEALPDSPGQPAPPTLTDLLNVFDLGDDEATRRRTIAALDRARSTLLARVRRGDGHWWTRTELLDALAALEHEGPEALKDPLRPHLAALAVGCSTIRLDALARPACDGAVSRGWLADTLLRAAWFPPTTNR